MNIPDADYVALLRMLIARATFRDHWFSAMRPGHWLHKARREVLIYGGPIKHEKL